MIRLYLAPFIFLAFLAGNAHGQGTLAIEQTPGLFRITRIGKSAIELQGASAAVHKAELRDLDIYDVGGKKLTTEEFLKRAKLGAVVLAAADENKVEPAYLKIFKEDTIVLVGVRVLLTRADKLGRGWTMDMKKLKANDDPLAGNVFGASFRPEKVQLLNTGLQMQSGKDMIHVFLHLKPGQGIEGKTFEIDGNEQLGAGRLSVHVHVHSTKPARIAVFNKDYAMRIEFGMEKEGIISGKMYLCLPDDQKSWIAGTFSFPFTR